MTAPRTLSLAFLLCLAPLVAAGCGDDEGSAAAGGGSGITVVATTTQAADFARAVAGDRDKVVGLIPANADPHDYEVRPGDVKALADADVVIRSGGDLDDWLQSAIDSSGTGADDLTLIDHVSTLESDPGHEHAGDAHGVDPHWWHDPRNAVKAVAAIETALAAADADGASAYKRNAEDYTRKLTELDGAVAACIDKLPPAQRKLVTTHDALGYYAQRYGLEVIGAVIPSLSTQAQASAGEVADLVDTIKREQVKAIFAESSVNPKLEQVVADQAGATIGKALWADTLGPKGSDGATYVASIASNTRAIVHGLSGGAVTCTLPG
jgi:ABC-type Zn uptake system ZnuABC Zn-binding protein ZnuA